VQYNLYDYIAIESEIFVGLICGGNRRFVDMEYRETKENWLWRAIKAISAVIRGCLFMLQIVPGMGCYLCCFLNV